jgi:long-chain acyl-CoA synthetase
MMELEERFQTSIDEGAFASVRDVTDLRKLLDQPVAPTTHETVTFPSWNRSRLAWFLRRIALPTWVLPLARVFARIEVRGADHVARVAGPVIFASNHQSHMDTPAILAALPPRRRYRIAPAMAKEFFKAHFFPDHYSWRQWLTNSVNYYMAALYFNAFPLPQREAGARETLRYAGELVDEGWSILIFPEGRRVEDAAIAPFQPGIGMLGARLCIPVVPVRIEGLDYVLPQSRPHPRVGRVVVSFGEPMNVQGGDYAALAKQVEQAVVALGA